MTDEERLKALLAVVKDPEIIKLVFKHFGTGREHITPKPIVVVRSKKKTNTHKSSTTKKKTNKKFQHSYPQEEKKKCNKWIGLPQPNYGGSNFGTIYTKNRIFTIPMGGKTW